MDVEPLSLVPTDKSVKRLACDMVFITYMGKLARR